MILATSLFKFCVLALPAMAASNEEISQDAADPTAPLPAITLEADHSPSVWGKDETQTTYGLSVVNPYYVWKQANLLHISLPHQGPALVTNLLVFKRSWGRWGAGASASLNSPQGGILAGPAWGIVRIVNNFRYGVLNLNYFSDNASLSAAQLIAAYSLGDGWTLSAGGFTPIWNWKTGSLVQLPISIQVARVVTLAGQPLQFFVNPSYNLQDTRGTPQWTVSVGVTFVANPYE